MNEHTNEEINIYNIINEEIDVNEYTNAFITLAYIYHRYNIYSAV